MNAIKYSCKGCGVRTIIAEGKAIRPCKCSPDTGVIADLSATATGEARVASK